MPCFPLAFCESVNQQHREQNVACSIKEHLHHQGDDNLDIYFLRDRILISEGMPEKVGE